MKINNIRKYFFGTLLALPLACSSLHAGNPQRAKEFIVMGYEGILYELKSGEGPYLRTLLELLAINSDDHSKTIEKTKAMAKSYPNIMDFAEQVIQLEQQPGKNGPLIETPPLPSGPGVYSGDQLENALNHLTRGMKITVVTKGGARFRGQFEEFVIRRLWVSGATRKSFHLKDILALEAPQL